MDINRQEGWTNSSDVSLVMTPGPSKTEAPPLSDSLVKAVQEFSVVNNKIPGKNETTPEIIGKEGSQLVAFIGNTDLHTLVPPRTQVVGTELYSLIQSIPLGSYQVATDTPVYDPYYRTIYLPVSVTVNTFLVTE